MSTKNYFFFFIQTSNTATFCPCKFRFDYRKVMRRWWRKRHKNRELEQTREKKKCFSTLKWWARNLSSSFWKMKKMNLKKLIWEFTFWQRYGTILWRSQPQQSKTAQGTEARKKSSLDGWIITLACCCCRCWANLTV